MDSRFRGNDEYGIIVTQLGVFILVPVYQSTGQALTLFLKGEGITELRKS